MTTPSSNRSLPRTVALALGLAALLLGGPRSAGADARVIDENGRLLTVGNWRVTFGDGGVELRVPDATRLSWELREGTEIVATGEIEGTADGLVDATPVLSRDPLRGTVLLAWSRLTPSGTRELVAMQFDDGAWQARTQVVVAEGTSNQLDPCLLHDAAGRAYLTWRDADLDQRIMSVILAPDLRELARKELSDGLAVQNGPPRLGVDARGGVYVAFFGTDIASGETRVFVLSTPDEGGGVIHLPNPVIELSRTTSLPVPAEGEPAQGGPETFPALHPTVLGGTAVVWWTEPDPDTGIPVFRHLYQTTDAGWMGSELGTVVLDPDADNAVREALELLEARLRRVVTRFADEQGFANPVRLRRDLVP